MTRIHVLPVDTSYSVSPIADKIAQKLQSTPARPYAEGEWYTQATALRAKATPALQDALVVDGSVTAPVAGLSLLGVQAGVAADDSATVLLVVNEAANADQAIAAATKVVEDAHAAVSAVLVIGGEASVEGVKVFTSADEQISDELAEELAGLAKASGSGVVTPGAFKAGFIRQAKSELRTIVLPEPDDLRVLQAAANVLEMGTANLVLLGEEAEIKAAAEKEGLDISAAQIVSPKDPERIDRYAQILYEARKHKGVDLEKAKAMLADVSYFGTLMIAAGEADGMVSGAVHTTAETIRPALQIIKTKPGTSTVSGSFFVLLEDRVQLYADCAVTIDPTSDQLADIAAASADTAKSFGMDPKVALISYSTGDSGKGPTVDKVKEAMAKIKEAHPELVVDGPLQFDAAFDPTVAAKKRPGSPVAGQANVFVFVNLDQGNCTYKAVQRTAGATAIGPVLQGMKKPVNDLSRGATVDDIVNTIVLTAIQAQEK